MNTAKHILEHCLFFYKIRYLHPTKEGSTTLTLHNANFSMRLTLDIVTNQNHEILGLDIPKLETNSEMSKRGSIYKSHDWL